MHLSIALPSRLRGAAVAKRGEADPAGAYNDGFAAGYKQGELRAQLELRRERERLRIEFSSRLAALARVHEELESLARQHLPSLVLAAASRLFQHHRFSDEEIFNEVSALLSELSQAGSVRIECNPADLEALHSRIADLGANTANAGVEWRPNAALANGEFVLTSDLGTLDGRRSARVQQLRLALEA